MPRLFADAAAASTSASPITAAQTTVTLASTAGFPTPSAGQQFSVVILDAGNPSFSTSNPLATPYEYQPVTTNAANVLTFGGGVRAGYAGTTPKAYFANATVSLTLLAEDLAAAYARLDQANAGVFVVTKQGSTGGTPTLGALQAGISAQSVFQGNDRSGVFRLTASASPPGAGSQVALVTFSAVYATAPVVLLAGGNNPGAFYSTGRATTGFGIATVNALAANLIYDVDYLIEVNQ